MLEQFRLDVRYKLGMGFDLPDLDPRTAEHRLDTDNDEVRTVLSPI